MTSSDGADDGLGLLVLPDCGQYPRDRCQGDCLRVEAGAAAGCHCGLCGDGLCLALVLAAGRAAGMPVIYTRAVQRPDGADATPRMRRLLASVAREGVPPLAGRSGAPSEIMDEVAPLPGDIVVDKLRWDAFHFTLA
jgi:hypothetical protein